MLQQTRVETVIPYFERFVARFRDPMSLASAELDEVLGLWAGLGYYSRARNLHAAACKIRDEYGGQLPLSIEELSGLPGIGRSTAGAVLSLAAGQAHPILDGNVKRVLSRVCLIDDWTGRAAVERRLWAIAEAALPKARVGAYNQGMMDLGATLCTRRSPRCDACPVQGLCIAHAADRQHDLPVPKPRRSLPRRAVRMLLIRDREDRVLLQRRPPAGIWGGLWSLPECSMDAEIADWCRDQLAVELASIENGPVRRHSFSHFELDIHLSVCLGTASAGGVQENGGFVWLARDQLSGLGFPAPVHELLGDSGLLDRRRKK